MPLSLSIRQHLGIQIQDICTALFLTISVLKVNKGNMICNFPQINAKIRQKLGYEFSSKQSPDSELQLCYSSCGQCNISPLLVAMLSSCRATLRGHVLCMHSDLLQSVYHSSSMTGAQRRGLSLS